MKATFMADVSDRYQGHAELFLLDETKTIPGGRRKYNHVVVSTVNHEFAHETSIFPSDRNGMPIDWSELPGSYRGGTDIDKALGDAGYEVVREK